MRNSCEQFILRSSVYDRRKFSDIALELGISKARVSQILWDVVSREFPHVMSEMRKSMYVGTRSISWVQSHAHLFELNNKEMDTINLEKAVEFVKSHGYHVLKKNPPR
jgi:hypothetical protein